MPAFLYYLPGCNTAAWNRSAALDGPIAAQLRDCLVAQAEFQTRLVLRNVLANGPDGGSGLLVAPVPAGGHGDQPLGVHPGRQEWHDCGSFWLGTDTELGIDPLSLLRPGAIEGTDVALNGLVWQVPVIRRGGMHPTLPQTLTRRGGKFERRLRADWQPVWQASGRIWDLVFGGSAQFEEVFDLCVQMLQVNYRVGPDELSVLESLDTENWRPVFEAVIDWPTVSEILEAAKPDPDPNAAAPAAGSAAGD